LNDFDGPGDTPVPNDGVEFTETCLPVAGRARIATPWRPVGGGGCGSSISSISSASSGGLAASRAAASLKLIGGKCAAPRVEGVTGGRLGGPTGPCCASAATAPAMLASTRATASTNGLTFFIQVFL
jgi:hypothetical protein